MNHPPMPPIQNKTVLSWIVAGMNVIHVLDCNERYKLACVARCAWADEAHRLEAELCGLLNEPGNAVSRVEWDKLTALRSAALDNAESWRKWEEE